MSRPRRVGTGDELEALLARDGPVWFHYCAVSDADPVTRGRDARAIEACMERFGIDRSTVQRKIQRGRQYGFPTLQQVREQREVFEVTARKIGLRLKGIRALISSAVEDGLISSSTAAQFDKLTESAVREIIAAIRRK